MRLLLSCLLLAACDGARVDACSSLPGEACVTFHLTGEGGIAEAQLTSVLMWIGYTSNGFVPHNVKLETIMHEPTSFPVAVGLHLPSGLENSAKVSIEALIGPGPLGYAFTTVSPNRGEHLERNIALQAVQLSGCFDGRFTSATLESDVDCGNQCAPCPAGKRCSSALDCQSTTCSNASGVELCR